MKKIWILARITLLETARRRIVLAGFALGLCFLAVFSLGFRMIYINSPSFGNTKTDPYQVMMINEGINTLLLAGLYGVTFLSSAMGALLGADTISGEITSGTIQTIVSKPVRRSDVVLGKWTGYVILLVVYSLLMSGGTVISVWIQSGYVTENILTGLFLVCLESLLIMTISLAYSSFLPGLATGGVVFGLYGMAFIGGWVEHIGAIMQNETAVQVGIVTSLIIPSEALWRRAAFEMQTPLSVGSLVSPFGTISIPSPLMVWYAVVYMILTLTTAVSIFNRRDL